MTTIRRTFVPRIIAALAVAVVGLAGAEQASASCAPAPPLDQAIAQADTVFVGTVQSTEHGGLTATFSVDDVWKGEVGETAVVHGGPGIAAIEDAARKGQGVATSVDRTYTTGTRYLVVSHGRADGVFLDNICSSTQPYTDELASVRPAGAHPPLGGGTAVDANPASGGGEPGPWLWALLGAFGALCAGPAIVLVRTRLRPGGHSFRRQVPNA